MEAMPAVVNAVPDGGAMVTKLALVEKVTTVGETSAPAASLTVAVAWVGRVVEPRAIVKVGVGTKVVTVVVPPLLVVVPLGVPLPQPARTMRVVVSKNDNEKNLEIFWRDKKFCTRVSRLRNVRS